MTVIVGYAHDDGCILACDSGAFDGNGGLFASTSNKYIAREDLGMALVMCGSLPGSSKVSYAFKHMEITEPGPHTADDKARAFCEGLRELFTDSENSASEVGMLMAVDGRLFHVQTPECHVFEVDKFSLVADGAGAWAVRGAIGMMQSLVEDESMPAMGIDVDPILRAMQVSEDIGAVVRGPHKAYFHPVPE